MRTVAFILLLVGSQTVLPQEAPGQNDCAPFVQADCQLLVVASLQRATEDGNASETASILLRNVTILRGETINIPSVCWSGEGDLTVQAQHIHSSCTSNARPREEHLLCLTSPRSGECPALASQALALQVDDAMQISRHPHENDRAIQPHRRLRRQAPSNSPSPTPQEEGTKALICSPMVIHVPIFDMCIDHGVSHALQRQNCQFLQQLEDCRGTDKLFCDCCSLAVTVRDGVAIQRDPVACSATGEIIYSGECLQTFILCCTGQEITTPVTSSVCTSLEPTSFPQPSSTIAPSPDLSPTTTQLQDDVMPSSCLPAMIGTPLYDECFHHGISFALKSEDCETLPEIKDCQGSDAFFCDCCSSAIRIRDGSTIQRDPQTCENVGGSTFSGKCLEAFVFCCTGQDIATQVTLVCNTDTLALSQPSSITFSKTSSTLPVLIPTVTTIPTPNSSFTDISDPVMTSTVISKTSSTLPVLIPTVTTIPTPNSSFADVSDPVMTSTVISSLEFSESVTSTIISSLEPSNSVTSTTISSLEPSDSISSTTISSLELGNSVTSTMVSFLEPSDSVTSTIISSLKSSNSITFPITTALEPSNSLISTMIPSPKPIYSLKPSNSLIFTTISSLVPSNSLTSKPTAGGQTMTSAPTSSPDPDSEPLHIQWRFAGTSYIEYWTQFHRAIQKFDLTVTFKLASSTGMLFFASQYKDGSGSFILIQMVNQIFQLGIGTGEEHSIISLPYTLELGKWSTVTATFAHSPGYAYLVHDGIIPSIGSIQMDRSEEGLSLSSGSLYIGDIPASVARLPDIVTKQGFVGCVCPIELQVVGHYTIEGVKIFNNIDLQCY